MKHAPLIAAGVLAFTTGCSGPSAPINVTLKSFPQQVRIGAAKVTPAPLAPLPPLAPPIAGGFVPAAPAPGAAPTAPPFEPPFVDPVHVCRKAPVGAVPAVPAGPVVSRQPSTASYPFRTGGKRVVSGANASTQYYPPDGTRVIGPTRSVDSPAAQGAFAYDVTAQLGANRTVTTYQVVPIGVLPASPQSPGVYVTDIKTLGPDGRVSTAFHPQPAMLVLPFPANQGSTFRVQSADPATGVVIVYDGEVGAPETVDACGSLVDTRTVTHTGTVNLGKCSPTGCTSGAAVMQFVGTYSIATQYGGLSVKDEVRVVGLTADAPFSDRVTGVISRVPTAR